MNPLVRRCRFIVVAAMVFSGLLPCAMAQLTYVTNSGAITITGYTGSGLSLIIPGATNGYPVTTIASAAFYNNSTLTCITIPNSVTNIGTFAFTASALVSATIPASVIGIGDQAFSECETLTNISVSATNPAYSCINGVLFDKAQDTLIQYPAALTCGSGNYTVPGSVITIGDYAFFGASGFASVTVPGSVTSIGDDSFAYCLALYNNNLTVYFGGNAPSLGYDSFYADGFNSQVAVYYLPGTTGWTAFSATLGSSLESASFWYQPQPKILDYRPYFGIHNNILQFTISWATNASVVVEACSNLINPVWLPLSTNTVTAATGTANFTDSKWMGYRIRGYRLVSGPLPSTMAQLTFVTNSGAITITGYTGSGLSLVIPSATNGYPVTKIASTAFENNPTLTNITIPNSVTNIGSFAFSASALVSITIPASVIGIGDQAFGECESLTNISVSATNPAYTSLNGVLFDKAQRTLIQYPAGLICGSGNYTIPGGVIAIGDYAFFDASGFASVTIPDSVTNIGNDSFADCLALNKNYLTVYFGGNAPQLGSDSFYADGFNGQVAVYYLPGTTGWTAFSATLGSSLESASFWYQPQPKILDFRPYFGIHNNQFQFTISWATNASVVVEACSNLINPVWLPLSTNSVTAATGTTNFTDSKWMGYRIRGYRLVSQ